MKSQLKVLLLTGVSVLAITACSLGKGESEEKAKQVNYDVVLKDYQGNALEGVTLKVVNGDEVLGSAVTDQEGKATIQAKEGENDFDFENMPDGLSLFDLPKTTQTSYEFTAYPFVKKNGEVKTGDLKTVGVQFHDFTVTLTDRTTVWTLSEQLKIHKVAIINCWASWCNPCMSEMGYIDQFYKRVNDRVSVLALNVEANDSDSSINTIKARKGWAFPTARDTANIAEWIYAEAIPTTFVIDRYGTMVEYEVGSQPNAAAFIDMVAPYLQNDYNPWANAQ